VTLLENGMTTEAKQVISLSSGDRPPVGVRLRRVPWPVLVDTHVHPVRLAVVEAFGWIGGPLSARELWLLGVGEPVYDNVAYHVRFLLELGLLRQTHRSKARGSHEKFYVLIHR
jgi:hypothetical protein